MAESKQTNQEEPHRGHMGKGGAPERESKAWKAEHSRQDEGVRNDRLVRAVHAGRTHSYRPAM